MVIKDKWCGEDCDSEADLLVASREAAIPGVTCLVAVDETFAGEKHLTTSSLRQSQGLETTAANYQAFCRIVLDLSAPTIQHFRSGLQLVQAFRDSIQSMLFPLFVASSLTPHILAHYDLVKVGILHRDISVDNIRLGPMNAPPGQRAMLVDLAQGTRCERGRPPIHKDALIVRLANTSLFYVDLLLRGRSCFALSTI